MNDPAQGMSLPEYAPHRPVSEAVCENDRGETPPVQFPTLTPRERMVATALAVGLTNREIAENLSISIKTVDTHRGNLLNKLKLRNNVELAREALRVGLVAL